MKLPVELQAGESVVARYRRHPVFVVSKLVGVGVAGLVPFGVALWVAGAVLGFGGVSGLIVLGLGVVWLAFWTFRAYLIWYRFEHDEWLVTNQRLIDAYSRNWFNRSVSSTDLINVQDMSIRKHGLLASIFNFGDLECETAGSNQKFLLSAIPRPADALALMDARRDAARVELHATAPRAADADYVRPPDTLPIRPADRRGRRAPVIPPRR